MKLLIFHNMVAPYRHELFSKIGARLECKVFFYTSRTKDRLWATLIPDGYNGEILNNFNIYIFGRPFTISFGVFKNIHAQRPNFVITTLTRANTLSIALLILLKYIFCYKLILWVGEIPGTFEGDNKLAKLPVFVKYLSNFVYKCCALNADGAICYSPLSDSWIRVFSPAIPTLIGGQICDPPPNIKPRLNCVENRPKRVIFAASATGRKGYYDALSAFSYALEHCGVPIEFHFIGDVSFPHLNEYGLLNNSRIHQFKNRIEFYLLLRDMDLLILPSYHDPWGNVVHEAMLMGTPAIVSTGCGAHTLVDDYGLTFSPGDVRRLADLIIQCLCCDTDYSALRAKVYSTISGKGHGNFVNELSVFLTELQS